jgi:hypothetical protein
VVVVAGATAEAAHALAGRATAAAGAVARTGTAAARRERQQQAQGQHPTLAGLRDGIKTAGLADGLHIEARDGRWHLQVQAVPADALWNWLLPCWPTRPSNCSSCN